MTNPQFLWPQGEVRGATPGVGIGGTTTTPFSNVNGVGGMVGGALGAAVPVPGAGLIGGAFGTGFDVHRANNQLEQLGLPRSVNFGPAAFNNASFGMFGTSARGQFDDAVTKAYPGLLQAMTPAPTMQEAPPSTPSLDYFGAINDYNTVGRLGDVLGGGQGAAESGGGPDPSQGAPDSGYAGDHSGNEYRRGGIVKDDGDGRLEAVKATVHETEGVIRPEVMAEIGAKNFRGINRGGAEMRQALARILRG